MFYIDEPDLQMMMICHVDDYIIGCSDNKWFENFLKTYNSHFTMNYLGKPEQFLGMRINWDDKKETMEFTQQKRINEMLDNYNMNDMKKMYKTPMESKFKADKGDPENLPNVPYRKLLGELYWISRTSRPDISVAVNILSRYQNCYTDETWKALRRVLGYLKYTAHYNLIYKKSTTDDPSDTARIKGSEMKIYCDSTWADDEWDGRSTTGIGIFHCGNLINWVCEKQKTGALSSSEAEYMALCNAGQDAVYFYQLFQELHVR